MKKILSKGGLAFFSLVLSFSLFVAEAYAYVPLPEDVGLPGNSHSTFSTVLGGWIRVIFLPIAGIITVFFIILGGFQYITSAGNEEQAEAGKKTLTNGIIGLVIIILSYIIVTVIINALGGATGSPNV